MSFGNFWMGFQSAMKHGVTIPAWDRASGELGWTFEIITVDYEHVQVATPQPQPRRIFLSREAGFRKVYAVWDSYNSGNAGAEHYKHIRRFLYISSIMHWYEQKGGAVQFEWRTG